jgi:hypothetical protein
MKISELARDLFLAGTIAGGAGACSSSAAATPEVRTVYVTPAPTVEQPTPEIIYITPAPTRGAEATAACETDQLAGTTFHSNRWDTTANTDPYAAYTEANGRTWQNRLNTVSPQARQSFRIDGLQFVDGTYEFNGIVAGLYGVRADGSRTLIASDNNDVPFTVDGTYASYSVAGQGGTPGGFDVNPTGATAAAFCGN